MSVKFKKIVEDFEKLKKDFESIQEKIANFPSPYYLMLTAKDQISIFPRDSKHDEQMEIVEAPKEFMPMN